MSKLKWQGKEIIWNVVNSMLAGGLVLLGGLSSSGMITKESIITSLIASLIVIVTKFSSYWSGEKKEYSVKLFKFI